MPENGIGEIPGAGWTHLLFRLCVMVKRLLAGMAGRAVPNLGQRCFSVQQVWKKKTRIDGGQMLGLHRAAATGLLATIEQF